MTETKTPSPRPFVKWFGGKKQLLRELDEHVPKKCGNYFEPFVGGGAFFFHIAANHAMRNATLSDLNAELVNAYSAIADDVEAVIEALQALDRRYKAARRIADRKAVYYEVRAQEIPWDDPARAAARTIFLNRTGWNGGYRVNRKGGFNIPMGRYKNPTICDADNLRACWSVLQGRKVDILARHFSEGADRVARGDFWYADPPYVPVTATSDFTAYTKEPFGPAEQEALAALARRLKKRGAHVLLSNSDVPFVRRLYKGFSVRRVKARRAVNCRTDRRGHVDEVLVW